MKPKMALLLCAAFILLAANIVKYSGIFSHDGRAESFRELGKISINYQKHGAEEDAVVKNNIFNGEAEDAGSGAPVIAAQKTPTPVPKVWPRFKISGFALNDGKKTAFFSGSEYSGAVAEGAEFDDGYILETIKDNKAVISDRATGEKKTYTLEGR
jgi:hypothetical protein